MALAPRTCRSKRPRWFRCSTGARSVAGTSILEAAGRRAIAVQDAHDVGNVSRLHHRRAHGDDRRARADRGTSDAARAGAAPRPPFAREATIRRSYERTRHLAGPPAPRAGSDPSGHRAGSPRRSVPGPCERDGCVERTQGVHRHGAGAEDAGDAGGDRRRHARRLRPDPPAVP